MYKISWDIQIGNFKLGLLESVLIKKSVENLSDTATIVLPGYVMNQALKINDKINPADSVSIRLGYDNVLIDEFQGYVESITTDGGKLQINCEDAIYLYRKSLKDVELRNVTLKNLLEHVNKEMGGFGLDCSYDFRYDKFVIRNATGWTVLKKVQEETKANVFFKGNTLHVHPQYSKIGNDKLVIYDLYRNVEKSELKFRVADQRKYEVEVVGTLPDGKKIKETMGRPGGEKRTINVLVTDRQSLIERGKQELANIVYTGYEGNFTGWLLPFCEPTFKVQIRDHEHVEDEGKQGNYYVIATETKISNSGGERVVTIGKKIG
jgi:hypothetical protein